MSLPRRYPFPGRRIPVRRIGWPRRRWPVRVVRSGLLPLSRRHGFPGRRRLRIPVRRIGRPWWRWPVRVVRSRLLPLSGGRRLLPRRQVPIHRVGCSWLLLLFWWRSVTVRSSLRRRLSWPAVDIGVRRSRHGPRWVCRRRVRIIVPRHTIVVVVAIVVRGSRLIPVGTSIRVCIRCSRPQVVIPGRRPRIYASVVRTGHVAIVGITPICRSVVGVASRISLRISRVPGSIRILRRTLPRRGRAIVGNHGVVGSAVVAAAVGRRRW